MLELAGNKHHVGNSLHEFQDSQDNQEEMSLL